MLLVGSFEPFDEAEAKRAGADDVVTKPFQSIRDLVSRVGSLVSRTPPHVATETDDDDSTVAVDTPSMEAAVEEHYPTAEMDQEKVIVSEAEAVDQVSPRVFVEAGVMETSETDAAPEHTCPPDIELQTADTQQLEPVPVSSGQASDTVEVEIVPDAEGVDVVESGDVVMVGEFEPDQLVSDEIAAAPAFDDDGVLDLGDVDSFAGSGVADDFELDVDVDPVQFSSVSSERADESVAAQVPHPYEATLETAAAPTEHALSEPATSVEKIAESHEGDLSPAAIEAISRRVVEQLSEKVVREIAWEVVPELSELLIKKRLDQR